MRIVQLEIVAYYRECVCEHICGRNLQSVGSDWEIGDSSGVQEGWFGSWSELRWFTLVIDRNSEESWFWKRIGEEDLILRWYAESRCRTVKAYFCRKMWQDRIVEEFAHLAAYNIGQSWNEQFEFTVQWTREIRICVQGEQLGESSSRSEAGDRNSVRVTFQLR